MLNKGWIYVFLTSLFELLWLYGFNKATEWWHWMIIIAMIAVDFFFLMKACESLPTGTVYAVFAGIGTVGTTLMDVYLLNGNLNLDKLFFIAIVIIGVIGLNLADYKDEKEAERKAGGN